MKLRVDWRDLAGGLACIAIGLFVVRYASQHYTVGETARMGPGFFPVVLGWVLTGLGGLIALLSNMIARGMYFGGSSRSSNRRGGGGGILVVILIVFAILAPIFAKLVQLAVSRQREYLADATSVRFTRNPAGLISALQRLDEAAKPFPGVSDATQHLFIVNPLRRFGVKASALFATHPATEQRIERLRNLGG
jgi:heat shock protein HtpX